MEISYPVDITVLSEAVTRSTSNGPLRYFRGSAMTWIQKQNKCSVEPVAPVD